MSNLVHIFTGTVEEVFPAGHPENPFSSGFLPWHYGTGQYRVAAVNGDDGIGRLMCYAEFPVQSGDRVQGFSCRTLGKIPVGVLVDASLSPLLAMGQKMEHFAEYTAYRLAMDASVNRNYNPWYLQYLNEDPLEIEARIRTALGTRPGCPIDTFLAEAHVISCSTKTELSYCKAMMNVNLIAPEGQALSFQIKRYADYFVPQKKALPLLVYPGQEDAIHMMPMIPLFAEWMGKMDEDQQTLITHFLRTTGFRMLGRILAMGRYSPNSSDKSCRIILTGKASGANAYYARAISIPDKSAKNRDAVCRCDTSYPIGTILEADIMVASAGQLYFVNPRPEKTVPKLATEVIHASEASIETENEADEPDTESEGMLTVRENELSLWRTPLSEDNSPHAFTISKNKNFNGYRFQTAVLQQQIDLLHYEVLHWIGFLRYTTGNFIFRLFLGGMLPQDPGALSPQQQQLAENILSKNTTKTKLLPEGDSQYPLEYPVRKNMIPTNRIVHKLQELGLIEAVGFRTRDGNITPSKVLILTQQGASLLQALRRRNAKFDTFAYLRSARQIKTTLSANQLAIAYLQGLNRLCPIPMDQLKISPCIILRPEGESKDAVVRPGFTLLARKQPNDKGMLLVGESIRNTVGLSKELDDQNIREKIPRMLEIVRSSALKEDQHTVLTFVFTTYDEMMSYTDFIREELAKMAPVKKFHLYLTYDQLLMGKLDGSHFRFHPETGEVERAPQLTEQLMAYLEEV